MIARGIGILCIGLSIALESYAIPQQPQPPGTRPAQPETLLSPGELDSLVAPVALYPDPILSQVLVASTYPVEIVEAARWLEDNRNLSGKALAEAAAAQPWDASVQALVLLPEVLNRLNEELRWTTDLGNAFLAQEEDVMDAVQRMRQKAWESGALRSTPQQNVSTITENNKHFIVIQPVSPQIVYVPVYNPVAVWGPPVYPFPALIYPPYTGVVAANAISFGVGMAVGSFWGGGWGGWGWNPGWGRSNIIVNNNFIRSNRFNRENVGPGNRWVGNRNRRGRGGPGNRNVANNRGNNRGSRPTAEQTRRRLNETAQRRGGAGRPSGANVAQRGRTGRPSGANVAEGGRTGRPSGANLAQRGGSRAGQGSAARMARGPSGEGQRARGNNARQGSANRTQQARPAQPRQNQNRGGNRQSARGSANRAASAGRNRGGAPSSANMNRGSANRSAVGSRGGGAGARGGASRARSGGGRRR
jgi:hypothetical protein